MYITSIHCAALDPFDSYVAELDIFAESLATAPKETPADLFSATVPVNTEANEFVHLSTPPLWM